ncbi:MAG: hypothetical protein J7498_02115 [Sphingobium sp.]|nr:hypothetical protein [Sphingobium sp.]
MRTEAKIPENAARMIAGEIKQAHASLDHALLRMLGLATSVIETSTVSALPAAASQPAIEATLDSLQTLAAGRSRFVDAHRAMVRVKGQSNLCETDLGCGFDNPLMMANRPVEVGAPADIAA